MLVKLCSSSYALHAMLFKIYSSSFDLQAMLLKLSFTYLDSLNPSGPTPSAVKHFPKKYYGRTEHGATSSLLELLSQLKRSSLGLESCDN